MPPPLPLAICGKRNPLHLCRGVQFSRSLMVKEYFHSAAPGAVFSAGPGLPCPGATKMTTGGGRCRVLGGIGFVVTSVCTRSIGEKLHTDKMQLQRLCQQLPTSPEPTPLPDELAERQDFPHRHACLFHFCKAFERKQTEAIY